MKLHYQTTNKTFTVFFSEWGQYQDHIYRLFLDNLPWADAEVCT